MHFKDIISGNYNPLFSLSRRRFVRGMAKGGAAIGGALAGFGLDASSLLATTGQPQDQQTLRGAEFYLAIAPRTVDFTGQPATAMTVNGSLPAPILRWREGSTVTLHVANRLPVVSSIHWHGIILPSAMDGVPGIATGFHGIAPGETFTYRFKINQSGTYWYHSHSGFQEQSGLYGPIVIDPKEGREAFPHDRDYVVMLSDWTDEDPMNVYAKLKKSSHYYNFNERTHADLMRDIREKGVAATWDERGMWNRMRMSQRDLSDVTGFTYTYLMNGQTPTDGWTGLFKKGEKVRLRFINGAAMTFFDVRIPGLSMTVVAADGQDIQPVQVDEFRIGVAETYDVIIEPRDDTAYTIFAQDIARSGYARGALAPAAEPSLALSAPIPEVDPIPSLDHRDMGMGAMDHGGHGMPNMGRARHGEGHDMGHHATMGNHEMPMPRNPNPSDFTAGPVHHAAAEYGPHVDMRAENPQYRLDDPGVGLRNNGRRVLTYADLKNLRSTWQDPEPDREIELHLTGNMRRYMWSIDGIEHADAEPLRWKLGERLRITLVNDTMMNHPMHLHGMWSDLETGDNNHLPRKHTVVVQPGARISYRVTVNAEGGWAYHCHLLYHMPGMFRTVVVS
uniref:Copper-resistance protein, CopA family n=1 Tax=Candidatus Kentrum sp. LPFa TaxID=2126335 RepID=A0A450WIX0_9GAMM|nr:MAG: copper-resistance protein, CopA family [Candidatus Kentron sp. LPFa]